MADSNQKSAKRSGACSGGGATSLARGPKKDFQREEVESIQRTEKESAGSNLVSSSYGNKGGLKGKSEGMKRSALRTVMANVATF